VKPIPPEDLQVEQKKRGDRRVEINRPKRSIVFNLESNKTREFKISDVVQSDDKVIRSAERAEPKTPGRLVKLKPSSSEASAGNEDLSKGEQTSSTAHNATEEPKDGAQKNAEG
jgi:hypothetical protein